MGRYCFSKSNSWSEESARYMYIWFIMITASLACLENAHIKVDVAINLFPKKDQTVGRAFGFSCFYRIPIVTAYLSGKYALNIARTGQQSLGLHLPMVLCVFCDSYLSCADGSKNRTAIDL